MPIISGNFFSYSLYSYRQCRLDAY